jgi:hypothetical protein
MSTNNDATLEGFEGADNVSFKDYQALKEKYEKLLKKEPSLGKKNTLKQGYGERKSSAYDSVSREFKAQERETKRISIEAKYQNKISSLKKEFKEDEIFVKTIELVSGNKSLSSKEKYRQIEKELVPRLVEKQKDNKELYDKIAGVRKFKEYKRELENYTDYKNKLESYGASRNIGNPDKIKNPLLSKMVKGKIIM